MNPSTGRRLAALFTVVAAIDTARVSQADEFRPSTVVVPATITSPLGEGPTPIDLEIDFGATLRGAGVAGVVDPNTIEVTNLANNARVPHALGPHIHYGDKASVRWLVDKPAETRFEVRFHTAERRPVLRPRPDTPLVGLGDLLRYTGPTPRPIGASLATRLVDVNADGALDLVTTDYYTTEPLWPERIPDSWSPFLCYPGLTSGDSSNVAAAGPSRPGGNAVPNAAAPRPSPSGDPMLFGNAVRFRYRAKPGGPPEFFIGGYMHADVADVNGDKLPDLVFASAEKSSEMSNVPDVARFIHIYLNTGKLDAGGMPELVYADRVEHPNGNWGPVRVVDLDRDGALDFVVGSLFSETNPRAYFIRNTNPAGWPIRGAAPAAFAPGAMAGFLDVDADGTLDSVCVAHDERYGTRNFCSRVVWRKGLGGNPPQYGPEQFLPGIDDELCEFVSTVDAGGTRGVLVSAGYIGERIVFYELLAPQNGSPRFRRSEAMAVNAPVRGGDQPTPCICDWNDDGRWDIVYGGGFGWIRAFINEGTNEKPSLPQAKHSLAPGVHALSEGKPINLHMTDFFPGIDRYWHDLGYVHPTFIDWDADGLKDLVASNVGNRIFWFKNVGKRGEPTFGPRQEVICDGYEDSPERTRTTAERLGSLTGQWKITPPDESSSPFWWRARCGLGDLNGDGLTDLVTADAATLAVPTNNFVESLTLFTQYRDADGRLRLKRDRPITLPDGSTSINVRYQPSQTIVHDWDGDGLLDLVINHGRTMDTAPAVLRNIGDKRNPKFDFPKRLACYGEPLSGVAKHGPYYGVGDIDGDGRSDLIASTEVGNYVFFRRTAIDAPKRPTIKLGPVRLAK